MLTALTTGYPANGDEDWIDGVDEGDNKSSDEGKSQDYNVWVDGEDDNY